VSLGTPTVRMTSLWFNDVTDITGVQYNSAIRKNTARLDCMFDYITTAKMLLKCSNEVVLPSLKLVSKILNRLIILLSRVLVLV
jgi:hypothetical protein